MDNLDTEKKKELIRELFLYVVGLRDLKSAKECLKKLCNERPGDGIDHFQEHAFVVYYGRIFHKNEGVGKIDVKSFKPKFSADEKLTHNYIMAKRNKFYAHNDPSHNSLMVGYIEETKKISAIAHFDSIDFSYNSDKYFCLLEKVQKQFEVKRDFLLKKLYSEKFEEGCDFKPFHIVYKNGFEEIEIKTEREINQKKQKTPTRRWLFLTILSYIFVFLMGWIIDGFLKAR